MSKNFKRFIKLQKLFSDFNQNKNQKSKSKEKEKEYFTLPLKEDEDININNIKKEKKEKNKQMEIDDNDNITKENSEENPEQYKKRIFNSKINEIYDGHFIERWDDDDDDDKEIEKIKSQSKFMKKSEAFKKQKILRKSIYDQDYDAGKQKKIKIKKEKSRKNHFQRIDTYRMKNSKNNKVHKF